MANDTDIQVGNDLPTLDVRTVAIIWSDGSPVPELILSDNTNDFEAIGMLRIALKRLEEDPEDLMDYKPHDDRDDDDDDF